MEHLEFEYYVDHYARLYTLSKQDANVVKQAKLAHINSVLKALQDIIYDTTLIFQKLKNQQAIYYMQHGVLRRLLMINKSYRSLIFTAFPERNHPLSSEETEQLTADLNLLYIKLAGVLDNLAQCFLYEKEVSLLQSLKAIEIGLFSKKLRKKSHHKQLWQELNSFDAWNRDLCTRRHPAAHIIPLYIPPALVTVQEAEKFSRNIDDAVASINNSNYEQADTHLNNVSSIGTFEPFFLHDPSAEHQHVYPTVPNDIGQLIKVYRIVREALLDN